MLGQTRDAIGQQLLNMGVASELAERVKEILELGRDSEVHAGPLVYSALQTMPPNALQQLLIELDGALES